MMRIPLLVLLLTIPVFAQSSRESIPCVVTDAEKIEVTCEGQSTTQSVVLVLSKSDWDYMPYWGRHAPVLGTVLRARQTAQGKLIGVENEDCDQSISLEVLRAERDNRDLYVRGAVNGGDALCRRQRSPFVMSVLTRLAAK